VVALGAMNIWGEARLNALASADLFLDTLPVNAHTICSDVLWAGLPVLTCRGKTFVSRVAGSLLRAQGLEEFVTGNLVEYEALARDPIRLAGLRARVLAEREQGVLFDTVRYTRHLEAAFAAMRAEYLATGRRAGASRAPLVIDRIS
jgi:protein O-GlcNAc transferase